MQTGLDVKNISIGIRALVAIAFFKVSPAVIIVISGLVGYIFF
ncbi:hypothetical protein [Clostridium formicaceticum]|nr:hypothetical protein [Clostridium formicaceticum]